MSVELADLHCETCDQVTEHELHYSGRLLESTRCTVCGAHLDVPTRDMLPAYLADLEQRVVEQAAPDGAARRPRTRAAMRDSCRGRSPGSRPSSCAELRSIFRH